MRHSKSSTSRSATFATIKLSPRPTHPNGSSMLTFILPMGAGKTANGEDLEKTRENLSTLKSERIQDGTDRNNDAVSPELPGNPQDWTISKKRIVTILVSCFSFNTMMTSTMIAPALSQIAHDFNIRSEARNQLTLSSYVISYSFGPLLWAPLSELYGRVTVLQVASTWFLAWNLACGFARSEIVLTTSRVMSGIGASSALAISSGMLSDCWRKKQRGQSLAIYTTIPLLGPAIGPIFGGLITHNSTWRWSFWSTSIFDALLQAIALALLYETHLPTLIRRQQRKTSSAPGIGHCFTNIDTESLTIALAKAFRRPMHLAVTQPTLQLLSVFSCVSFGILYIIISMLPMMFIDQYGQGHVEASLNYISFGVGFIVGAQVLGVSTDWIYQRQTSYSPESRLFLLLPSIIIAGLSLICMGWSAQARTHWIVPNIGLLVFAAGIQFSTQCQNVYVIDVYGPSGWSASAMAGIWVVKSAAGFAFPLFGPAMYGSLGWGWGCGVLATALIAAGVPVAMALHLHGDVYRRIGEKRLEA